MVKDMLNDYYATENLSIKEHVSIIVESLSKEELKEELESLLNFINSEVNK